MKKRILLIVLGLYVMLIGAVILNSGLGGVRMTADGSMTISPQQIRYLQADALAGKPLTGTFGLSSGNMTVAIYSQAGFDELTGTGEASSGVYLLLTQEANGTFSWTPSVGGTYYVGFHTFTKNAATLLFTVAYTGQGTSDILFGAVAIVIGVAFLTIPVMSIVGKGPDRE